MPFMVQNLTQILPSIGGPTSGQAANGIAFIYTGEYKLPHLAKYAIAKLEYQQESYNIHISNISTRIMASLRVST